MSSFFRKLLLAFMVLPAAALAEDAGLPSWLGMAPGMVAKEIAADERYGEARIPTLQQPQQILRGRHWEAFLTLAGVDPDASGKALWARWKPVLLQGGWTVAQERDSNPFSVSLRLTQGRDAWLNITLFAADDIRMDLVEVGENRLRLQLQPPSAGPQPLKADNSAFPFLPPPPGARFTGVDENDKPMLVTLRDKNNETRLQVATGSVSKYYQTPKDLSNLDFALAYRDALLAAGWTVPRFSQGIDSGDALLVAHYGANGRDLWAVLRHAPGEASFEVGDAGRSDLAQALRTDCRVTLLGVLFDFDKATLKSESDAVLTRARAAIAANPGLSLEVEGHTDAVGNDAYNQKLSEARAQAVVAWLTAKGTPAAQLRARGYGESRPVATNDTDDGRASNRRVELACQAR